MERAQKILQEYAMFYWFIYLPWFSNYLSQKKNRVSATHFLLCNHLKETAGQMILRLKEIQHQIMNTIPGLGLHGLSLSTF